MMTDWRRGNSFQFQERSGRLTSNSTTMCILMHVLCIYVHVSVEYLCKSGIAEGWDIRMFNLSSFCQTPF